VIARVRALAVGVARAWMDQQYGTGKTIEKSVDVTRAAKKEKQGKLAPAVR